MESSLLEKGLWSGGIDVLGYLPITKTFPCIGDDGAGNWFCWEGVRERCRGDGGPGYWLGVCRRFLHEEVWLLTRDGILILGCENFPLGSFLVRGEKPTDRICHHSHFPISTLVGGGYGIENLERVVSHLPPPPFKVDGHELVGLGTGPHEDEPLPDLGLDLDWLW